MGAGLSSTSATRIVIITPEGQHEFWADSWTESVQVGGQTPKLFARGSGDAAREELRESLIRDLGRI
jgi:hypothetical protein